MTTPTAPRTTPLLLGGGLVLLLALGVALFGGRAPDDGFDLAALAAPVVQGAPLQADVDVTGTAAPVATTDALLGDGPVVAPVDGTPTLLVFLAHWCSHCNDELPVLDDWLASGGLPDGVALRGVATAIDPARPHYPPTTWLDEAGWDVPTLVDGDGSIAAAFGVTGYPGWVAVAADGTVLARSSGPQDVAALDAVTAALAATAD
jgi:thiol-disulfide isomerase/thioredoxin